MAKMERIPCPGCGAEMNRHAEKVDYTAGLAEPAAVDPDLGGVLEEMHQCPKCPEVVAQRA